MAIELKKIKIPSSLSQIAYTQLKESLLAIDVFRLPDDERLDERELAKKLGVSRTPLREAINRLEVEGFLKTVPRKGIFVVKKSKKEIIEILLTRAALEGMGARLAAELVTEKDIRNMSNIFSFFDPQKMKGQYPKYAEANVQFHELVLKSSQCGKLIEIANGLFDHMRWIRFHAVLFEGRLKQVHEEHLRIIDALEKHDPDLAERRTRDHIEGLAHFIEKVNLE